LRQLGRKQADLDEEISFHLEEEAHEQAAAGLSAEDARLAARRDFGNVMLIRENTRALWSWTSLERLVQDIRYGWRMLRSTPLVSCVAVLSLALGIDANTAIFSVLDTLILRQLPVDSPERLAILGDRPGHRPEWTNRSGSKYASARALSTARSPFRPRASTCRLAARANSSMDSGRAAGHSRSSAFTPSSDARLPTKTIVRVAGRTVRSPSSATASGSVAWAAQLTR